MAGHVATAAKIAAVVPLFLSVADQAIDFYRKHTSNGPQARYEALKKWREASARAHKSAMQDLEDLKNSMEESSRKNDQAVQEHFRMMRNENDKSFQDMWSSIQESDRRYEEKIRLVKKEHNDRMRAIDEESVNERKEVERGHEELMRKLEEEHQKEQLKAEKKLEEIKSEGDRLVKEEEKELKNVEKLRRDTLDLIHSEQKRLAEEFEKRETSLRKENCELKKANIQDRIKHIEKQSEVTIQQIETRTKELLDHCSQEASKAMIKSFRRLLESVYKISDSLANIESHCLGGDVAPGVLTADFELIGREKAMYLNAVTNYRQTALNSANADKIVHNTFASILANVNQLVSAKELDVICARLPTALTKENWEAVLEYGKLAEELTNRFRTLTIDVETRVHNLSVGNDQNNTNNSIED